MLPNKSTLICEEKCNGSQCNETTLDEQKKAWGPAAFSATKLNIRGEMLAITSTLFALASCKHAAVIVSWPA